MASFERMCSHRSIGIAVRALSYPVWKNWSMEQIEIKKRRLDERTEAFDGTLSVGRSSARIAGSVLFGRVEGVKEGRTRAA